MTLDEQIIAAAEAYVDTTEPREIVGAYEALEALVIKRRERRAAETEAFEAFRAEHGDDP